MNIRVVFCVIVCGLVLAFVGRAGGDPPGRGHSQRVFKVGVLASLTGSWSSLGQNTVAALESAEVAMIKPYADAHDILVISQGSTASSLAIADDNIFRFCPNDTREAEAIVALMWHDGIRSIVPLWRNDAGNNGLHDSVQAAFQALGGTVASGFRYEPSTTDFSAATSSIAADIASLGASGFDPQQ